ncbi:hypothetical protein YYC_02408 [Plasmodium yoelii 17X]|uniref:Uncharacterized protein n=2 Tax=Plasmodium yoelii 17X TaxID=1323249 RepID=V7PKC4_PLAYE|nr:hypothetical protein YYC_02408 [Plasmodium yoelii 17X]
MDRNSNGNTYGEINSTLNEPLDDSATSNNNESRTTEPNVNDQVSENRTSEAVATRETPPRTGRRSNALLIISMITGLVANQLTGQQSSGLVNQLLNNNMFVHMNLSQTNSRNVSETRMLGINRNNGNETTRLSITSEIQNNNESAPSDVSNYINEREDDNASENAGENVSENAVENAVENAAENVPENASENVSDNVSDNASENESINASDNVSINISDNEYNYNYNRNVEDEVAELISNSATEYIRLLEGDTYSIYDQPSESNLRGSRSSTPINQKSNNNDNGFSELSRILDGDYSYNHETDRFEYTHSPENNDIELTPISSLTLTGTQYDDYDNAVFADKYLLDGGGSITGSVDSDEYDYEREYEMLEARRNLNTNRIPISDIYRSGRFTLQTDSNEDISFNFSENYDGDIFFYNDREYAIGGEGSRINQNNSNVRNYGSINYTYGYDDDDYDYEFGNFEFTYSRPSYVSFRGDGMISFDSSLDYDNDELNESDNLEADPFSNYQTNYRSSMNLRQPPNEEFTFGDTPPSTFSLTRPALNLTPLNNAPSNNAPSNNAPSNNAPLNSTPLYSTPLYSTPLYSTPLNSGSLNRGSSTNAPLNSTPLNSTILNSGSLNSGSLNNPVFDDDDDDIEILNEVAACEDIFDEIDLGDGPMDNINLGRLIFNDTTINGTSFNDSMFSRSSLGDYSFGNLRPINRLFDEDVNSDNIRNVNMNRYDSMNLDNDNIGSDSELQPLLYNKRDSYESDNESNESEYFDALSNFEYNSDEDYSGSLGYFESKNNSEPIASCSNSTTAESYNENNDNNTSRVKEKCEEPLNSRVREESKFSYLYDDDEDDDFGILHFDH